MTYTKEQITEKYRKLPPELQESIFSVDTAEILQKISKENSLRIDQMAALADETGLVMLGLTGPNDFIPHLTERLGLDRENARKLGQEVNVRVFSKVREALKEIHGMKSSSAENTEGNKNNGESDQPQISRVIKPQKVLAEKTFDTDLGGKEKTIDTEREALKNVAESIEEQIKPEGEALKEENLPPPPPPIPSPIEGPIEETPPIEPGPEFAPPASPFEPPASAVTTAGEPKDEILSPPKDMFSERTKEEGFRSASEIVNKVEPTVSPYGDKPDPYREDPAAPNL